MNRFTQLSALLGFCFIVVGASMIYEPLGFISAGGLLLGLSVVTAKRKK